jgi:hypothetical protein
MTDSIRCPDPGMTRVIRDKTLHRESSERTKDEGHRGLAGRRIVEASEHTWQGSMRGCLSGSCRGFYGVLGQRGIHLAHPLIDLEGECVPPPTEP